VARFTDVYLFIPDPLLTPCFNATRAVSKRKKNDNIPLVTSDPFSSDPFSFGICSVAWAEFLCGPLDATAAVLARQMFPNPEAFLTVDAVVAADLFNQTGRRSRSLPDCMIAAVAIRCGARLATINLADYVSLQPFGLVLA
jgi:predicted nucleic acid-binding protein